MSELFDNKPNGYSDQHQYEKPRKLTKNGSALLHAMIAFAEKGVTIERMADVLSWDLKKTKKAMHELFLGTAVEGRADHGGVHRRWYVL